MGHFLGLVFRGYSLNFCQGGEGVVVIGLVNLLLGDGHKRAGDNLFALGNKLCGFLAFALGGLCQGGAELGQGLRLIGLQGGCSGIERFYGFFEILRGNHCCGKPEGCKCYKKSFHGSSLY